MSQIDAIYREGVFLPLGTVDLSENSRVRFNVEVVPVEAVAYWFEFAREARAALAAVHGEMPDSSLDIADDRRR